MKEIIQAIVQAIHAYGEAARNDYFSLDGKQIQQDMWTIADALESGDTHTMKELIGQLGITKTNLGYEWEK